MIVCRLSGELYRSRKEGAQAVALSQTASQALYSSPRPFRKLDEKGSLHWDRITRLEKGKIYRQVRTLWGSSA